MHRRSIRARAIGSVCAVDPLAGEQTIFSDAELEETGLLVENAPYDNGTAMNSDFVSRSPRKQQYHG